MYSKISLDSVESRDIDVDGVNPKLKAIGYELKTENMRPSVWIYEKGDSNNLHKQEKQEELYYIIDGKIEIEVDDDLLELAKDDFVVVSPDSWRKIRALEKSIVLAIGAPNVKDDAIIKSE